MTANVIIRQVLLKRGNTAATSVYTGPIGEVVVDTDLKNLRVQDGLTPGGTLLTTAATVTAANAAMKSYVDNATSLLWSNAATQANTLSTLIANAAFQGTSLDTLTANAATQQQTLVDLISNAAIQADQLDVATANAIVQSQLLDVLVANAASQGQYLDSLLANLNTETTNLWSNAAVQETEISNLRANITAANVAIDTVNANLAAANTAIVTANNAVVNHIIDLNSQMLANVDAANTAIVTANNAVVSYIVDLNGQMLANVDAANAAIVSANIDMKSYVDALSEARTGNITFTGRTIGADANGDSGIVFDSAGNGEIHIMDYTGINNPNPEHWLHIGDSGSGAAQNTGDLAIDFSNGQDTHTGHVTWTWDWWDTALSGYKGTHNDGSGTHARFVLLKDHGFDTPLITIDYTTGNVTVADFGASSGTFSGNVNAQNVIIDADIKWGNGTPFLSGVFDTINAANISAADYTDISISNLVNGAPALLDTLYEIANSLGNNSSLSTTLLNLISNIEVNVSTLTSNISTLTTNAAVQNNELVNLWSNAATQGTEIDSLRANIAAANVVIVNTLTLGNLQVQDTTLTTKEGANPTIILDAGGEVVIRDNTGIGNENPGWLLHVGDALANIAVPEGETHGPERLGQLAIDYAAGLPYVDGLPPSNNNGRRGSVVFDWQYWTSGSFGNYNLRDNAAYREFGLYRDGDHNHELFAVDLDTHEFRVNSLVSTANIHSLGSFTGNVRTDGYFFANGAPLVIPPLVTTGNTAPTVEQGATEGALWWNDGDGRAYIKYGDNWVDFSPTVLPPVSRYIGNVVFTNHNITNVGNVTPHANDEYNLGTSAMRWNAFYTDTIDTTGNVAIGGNLYVYGNVTNVATQSLTIDDSLIYLANNNPGNSIDIGIAGNFNDGSYQHTGFVRDASDNKWKLFSNVVAEPSATIDFAFAVYDDIQVGQIYSPTVNDLYDTISFANLNINNRVDDLNGQMLANVNAANTAIVTANNAVVSYIVDLNGQMLANVDAANTAIVTANNAVVSYIVDLNGQMLANVDAANSAIVTANLAMNNRVTGVNNSLTASINAANLAIVTANNAVVSHIVDLNGQMLANLNSMNSAMVANVTATNAAIVTANVNLKNYTDDKLALKANLLDPTFTNNVTISGNLIIGVNSVVLGNFQVQGTTTTVNQTSLTLTDKLITLANGSVNSSMANNAGLYVPGAEATVLYKTLTDSWTFNKPLYFDANVVWHAGNDGAGSGLDADTLDGLHASSFSLTSHSHNYLSSTGGTISGNVTFDNTASGIVWSMNTDGAYVKFFNTGDSDTDSRLEYGTSDNGNEYHRWTMNSVEKMNLKADGLNVTVGNISVGSGSTYMKRNDVTGCLEFYV